MRIFFLAAFLYNSLFGLSIKDSTKTKFSIYGMWGYNRNAYTTSTLHFVNNGSGPNQNYNFKVHDVKAHDRPDFHQIKDVKNLTIPQYNIRLGMWLNNTNDEGFEINYDHAKYVVTNYQTARFTGVINGQNVDKDSILDPSYFHFEHTDGANFWMLNYMKRIKIFHSKNKLAKLSYVVKPGLGVLIPRTDVTLFGQRLNNDWKVSGICAGLEVAFHAEIYKHFIVEFSGKGGWANYTNSLVQGKGNGKASHKFGFLEGIFCFGYQL